jgi:hypothetical protein
MRLTSASRPRPDPRRRPGPPCPSIRRSRRSTRFLPGPARPSELSWSTSSFCSARWACLSSSGRLDGPVYHQVGPGLDPGDPHPLGTGIGMNLPLGDPCPAPSRSPESGGPLLVSLRPGLAHPRPDRPGPDRNHPFLPPAAPPVRRPGPAGLHRLAPASAGLGLLVAHLGRWPAVRPVSLWAFRLSWSPRGRYSRPAQGAGSGPRCPDDEIKRQHRAAGFPARPPATPCPGSRYGGVPRSATSIARGLATIRSLGAPHSGER